MRSIRIITVAAALLLALPAAIGQAQSNSVEVVDNSFMPATVTISPGDTVTWEVTGSNPHTITAEDGSFDQTVGNGDTFEQTYDEPGTYAYYCRFHGTSGGSGMSGTVVVEGAAAEPTPAETEAPAITGSLVVSDQSGDGTSITVDSATIEGSDGFVVVHSDNGGAPGPVLGHAAISEGTTTDVAVPMDEALTSNQTVWPMLHFDAGTAGEYEFPGADGPVSADGSVVVEPLAFTLQAAGSGALPATGRDAVPLAILALAVLALGAGAVRRGLA